MKDRTLKLRPAEPRDSPGIAEMIRGMAQYENLEDQLEFDETQLREALFGEDPVPRAIVATQGGQLAGYAIFYYNFSTFLGKRGIFLEDLYVAFNYRGQGIGDALFTEVAKIAGEEDCGRMEWTALDWNLPALEFYRARGAKTLDGWKLHRLTRDGIEALAERSH